MDGKPTLPFPHYDKVAHYLGGIGASAFGRMVSRKLGKEKYEDYAALLSNIAIGGGVEYWEYVDPFSEFSQNMLKRLFNQESKKMVFDFLDVGASFAGYLTEQFGSKIRKRNNNTSKSY